MENFFNADVAAYLQYFTFPLEIVGLALALIEVRFPKTARYLEQQIAKLAAPMDEIRSGQKPEGDSMMAHSLGTLLSRIITSGFLLLTVFYVVQIGLGLAAGEFSPEWLIGQAFGFVVAAIAMTVTLVVVGVVTYVLVISGSDFARRFAAGHAIGTLGILIASVGLLGEFYQVITQIVS